MPIIHTQLEVQVNSLLHKAKPSKGHKGKRAGKNRALRMSERTTRIGSTAGRKSIMRGKNTPRYDVRTIGKAGPDFLVP